MAFALRILNGNRGGESFSLSEGRVLTIGRDAENDIRLADRKLSRIHCQLEVIGGRCQVADLNSTNGTRVNGEVVTRITDNGCGIPQDIKDQLFEPFQSTKPHGSGLVLFATKHILEMHRGSLKVESEVGLGTTVTITLPIHQSPAEN